MKTVILESFTDQEFGNTGLRVADAGLADDFFAATQGLVLAHDLIEHQNGVRAIGGEHGIDDELEALGAVWAIRGQFDDLRRDGVGSRYSAAENLSSDFVRMFGEHCAGAYVGPCPRTRPCDLDADFIRVLDIAARDWPGDSHQPHVDAKRWPHYRRVALARMRIGYRKALRRFGSMLRANALLWAVADAVDPCARHAEYDGRRFRLRYGFEGAHAIAYCNEVESDDDYS